MARPLMQGVGRKARAAPGPAAVVGLGLTAFVHFGAVSGFDLARQEVCHPDRSGRAARSTEGATAVSIRARHAAPGIAFGGWVGRFSGPAAESLLEGLGALADAGALGPHWRLLRRSFRSDREAIAGSGGSPRSRRCLER